MDAYTTESQCSEALEQGSVAEDFWYEPVLLAEKEESDSNDTPSFGCGSTCAQCGSTCAQCGSTCAQCGSTCAQA